MATANALREARPATPKVPEFHSKASFKGASRGR